MGSYVWHLGKVIIPVKDSSTFVWRYGLVVVSDPQGQVYDELMKFNLKVSIGDDVSRSIFSPLGNIIVDCALILSSALDLATSADKTILPRSKRRVFIIDKDRR